MESPVGELFVKTGCPFCAKVLKAGEELNICFDIKNVADQAICDELIAKGGKKQEPYFVDRETGVGMYESGLIISFLSEHYGTGAPIEFADDAFGNTCPI